MSRGEEFFPLPLYLPECFVLWEQRILPLHGLQAKDALGGHLRRHPHVPKQLG